MSQLKRSLYLLRMSSGCPSPKYNELNDRTNIPVDFSDTRKAFRSKTTWELLRHYFVFSAFKFEVVISRSRQLVHLSQKLLGQRMFRYFMKKTIYGQFVAGEDLKNIQKVIARYKRSGVKSILDYSVEEDVLNEDKVVLETRTKAKETPESVGPYDSKLFPQFKPTIMQGDATARASARTYFYATEKKCDDVMRNFLSCVNAAADATEPGDAAFAAIKLTGLGRVEFLLKLSEMVEGTHQLFLDLSNSMDVFSAQVTPKSFYEGLVKKGLDMKQSEADRLYRNLDTDNKEAVGLFEWLNRFQPGSELYKLFRANKSMQPLLALLDEHDMSQMQNVVRRAHTIAECAEERRVHLMIDAEQSYFQPAIRHIAVYILMQKHNREYPVVFNTVQCYLKNAMNTLKMDLEFSKASGFSYGVKLVRGAYLEQEKKGAEEKGAADPIWNTKQETDHCFDSSVEYLLKQVKENKINMMVATHNEVSVGRAIDMMDRLKINKSDNTVVFGQLLGMCDYISFTLGGAGYGIYKYMPYGPVELVIPYLIRRAYENRGMLEGANKERLLVKKEIVKRLFKIPFS